MIVEIQNSLLHVSAMQCPKCSHYQDFSSLGACKTCGRSDWHISDASSGGTIVACPHCERGPSEVPCEKCGAKILGSWLSKTTPASIGEYVLVVVIILVILGYFLASRS